MSAGADYIGFVFAPSKRQVTLEQAAELAKIILQIWIKVGVFVSPSRADLLEAIEKVGLDFVQVHGQVVDKLFENLPCGSIQAVQVDEGGHCTQFSGRLSTLWRSCCRKWTNLWLGQLDTTELAQPFFIAGGLNEDNVARAISISLPLQ